jgi:hypothetical protein
MSSTKAVTRRSEADLLEARRRARSALRHLSMAKASIYRAAADIEEFCMLLEGEGDEQR